MTEAQIIQGCKRGKAECQRELVLRYSPMLLSVARRYMGDDHRAKDVLQEAFIRIFKNIDRYRHTGSFEAWMRTIIINGSLQYLNKACFRREINGLDSLPTNSMIPEVYAKIGADELLVLVQRLPEGYRQVFNLAVIEGYRHDEIAKMLGITASNSRSQLSRARNKLQQMIVQRERKYHVSK